MQAPKLYANYKCECYGHNFCSCRPKDAACDIFSENVADVADAIAEVMVICGIHPCKARASTEVIVHAFEHYDEIRHRVDAVPHKRLCREDFIHDMGLKCMMTRMEAQLAYSITKRAFKAFYHGTCEGGLHNPILEAQLIHSQECMWVHAARRTAQIFAAYEGMFLSAEQNYEALIRCVYKRLYDKLLARSKLPADQMQPTECDCKGCLKKAISFSKDSLKTHTTVSELEKDISTSTTKMPKEPSILANTSCKLMPLSCATVAPTEMAKQNAQIEEQARLEKTKQWQTVHPGENAVVFCKPCMCPRLICDCNAKPGTPSLECSQGPYVCRWLPVIPEEEVELDPCDILVEEHECPIDCMGIENDEESCDTECICDCGKSCECPVEEMSSDYEDGEHDAFEIHTEMAEEHELDMSDGPTYAGCCVMLNHIAEEMKLAENPLSIAHIEGHRNEASKRSEHQVNLTIPKSTTTIVQQKPRQLSEEEQKKEAEEISKLLASMI